MELEAPGDWQLWPATRLSEVATMDLDAPRHLWQVAPLPVDGPGTGRRGYAGGGAWRAQWRAQGREP
jgi:hypothetical protein